MKNISKKDLKRIDNKEHDFNQKKEKEKLTSDKRLEKKIIKK